MNTVREMMRVARSRNQRAGDAMVRSYVWYRVRLWHWNWDAFNDWVRNSVRHWVRYWLVYRVRYWFFNWYWIRSSYWDWVRFVDGDWNWVGYGNRNWLLYWYWVRLRAWYGETIFHHYVLVDGNDLSVTGDWIAGAVTWLTVHKMRTVDDGTMDDGGTVTVAEARRVRMV